MTVVTSAVMPPHSWQVDNGKPGKAPKSPVIGKQTKAGPCLQRAVVRPVQDRSNPECSAGNALLKVTHVSRDCQTVLDGAVWIAIRHVVRQAGCEFANTGIRISRPGSRIPIPKCFR